MGRCPGAAEGPRPPRSPVVCPAPLPSGVGCGAAPLPGHERGRHPRARGTTIRRLLGSARNNGSHWSSCHLSTPLDTPAGPRARTPPPWPFHSVRQPPGSHQALSHPSLDSRISSARVVTSGYPCRLGLRVALLSSLRDLGVRSITKDAGREVGSRRQPPGKCMCVLCKLPSSVGRRASGRREAA